MRDYLDISNIHILNINIIRSCGICDIKSVAPFYQQTIECLLKHMLDYDLVKTTSNNAPNILFTHNLVNLVKRMKEVKVYLKSNHDELANLTNFYFIFRYPNVSESDVSQEELLRILSEAEKIVTKLQHLISTSLKYNSIDRCFSKFTHKSNTSKNVHVDEIAVTKSNNFNNNT